MNFSSLDSVPKALPKGSTGSLQSVRFFGGRESIACRNSSMCRRQSSAPKSAVLTLPIERSAVRSSRLAFASGPALTQHTVVDRGPAALSGQPLFTRRRVSPCPAFGAPLASPRGKLQSIPIRQPGQHRPRPG